MTGAVPLAVPLSVHLAGLRVVVVGAGRVAARKLRVPLDARADLHVVAPDAVAEIRAAARDGRLVWHRRRFRAADLDGAVLTVAATADPAANAAVAAAARERALLCVRVDGGGTAAFPATVRRGPLTLAVSTGGAAPALAGRLREDLERRYGAEYGDLAAVLGELRADEQVRQRLGELPDRERRARWRAVLDADILPLLRAGHVDRAKEVARSCLLSSSA